jgi:Cu(I)/Ag(I) efflux system membrane protein CusA/SilA
MADVGIVLVENIAAAAKKGEKNFAARVLHASAEVFLPVTIAVATTVLGFLPVFFLTEAEGKLFRPLAATKTLTIVTALFIALFLLPPLARFLLHPKIRKWNRWLALPLLLCNFWLLGVYWQPLGQGFGNMKNIMATVLICGLVLLIFYLFYLGYEYMLRFLLRFRFWFLSVILLLVFTGFLSVFGAGRFFALFVRNTDDYFLTDQLTKIFPGIGTEFMPTLQEGSFLYMPTTMTHAGVEEVREIMAEVHERIAAIPEVEMVVGKAGRAESALDPAPLSMIESVIQYKPEFAADAQGKMVRQWRKEINSVADIWDEVVRVTKVPGLTSAPFLQPIAARIVMLQSGMRAPLGIKLSGQDLDAMEVAGLDLETIIREVPGVRREAVFAERIVGKPYLEVHWDREKLALHGLSMGEVQRNFEWGVGGVKLGEILIGRTRFPLTMRYFPVKRNSPEDLAELPIRTPAGLVLRLSDLGILHYRRGPQVIRGENARLISYVIFDKQSDISDGEVIERVRQAILQAIAAGRLKFGKNISWSFAGSFENQARANKRLLWIVPLTLLIIFALIAAKFSFVLTMMIFSSIMVAWSGGFLFLWFLNSPLVSAENPYLSWLGFFFPLGSVHLSVAVWVGFLSLFGIATDDGVLIAGFLRQEVGSGMSRDKFDLYENIVRAGKRRIRACLMTTATTVVALLPVLTATGKGSELMIPMALPVFGGMMMALLTLFVVPVLYSFTYFFKK